MLGEPVDVRGGGGGVEEADLGHVEAVGEGGGALGGEGVADGVVADEGDVAQLAGVAGDDGAPAAQEGGCGEGLVDVACFVEDDEVEQAGHGGQDVLDVGEGADPDGQGPDEVVGCDEGEGASAGGAAGAQGRGEGGDGASWAGSPVAGGEGAQPGCGG
ncbi:hypothetical protein NUG22_38675, partial [Saccharothrix longispora]|nr:hypothetical protein [Saccharothrix longispora]